MKLKDYMEAQGWTARYLANRLDVTVSAARKWIQGTRTPRLATLNKIHKITHGNVSFDDWD